MAGGDLGAMAPSSAQRAGLVARAALVVLAGALIISTFLDPDAYVMRIIQSAAVLGIFVTAGARCRRGDGPGWLLLALGGGAWLLALCIGWISVALDSDDLLLAARSVFTFGAALALLGLMRMLSAGNARRAAIQALDGVVVAASLTVILSVALAERIDLDVVRQTMTVPLLAPVVSLTAAAYAMTAAINQPTRVLPRWMALGFAIGVAGDVIHMVELTDGAPTNANGSTPVLAAAAVVLLVAVLTPDPRIAGRSPLPRGRRLTLSVVVLTALMVGTIDVFITGIYRPMTMLAGLILMVAQTLSLLLAISDLRSEQAASGEVMEQLRTSEARLHLAIDAAPLPIGVAGADGRLMIVNRALADLVGTAPESLIGRDWGSFLEPTDTVPSSDLMRDRVFVVSRADGSERLVEITRRRYPSPDGSELWLGIGIDVTDRIAAVLELEHRATHDELTNLPNRRHFTDRLDEHISLGQAGVLAVFDLDQFKFVNDTLGHSAGDRLLTVMADRVRSLVEDPSDVARIGGDEFCVLLPEHEEDPLERVAELFSEPFDLDGELLHATASVGGTLVRPEADPERLVAEADAAMYRAKGLGPGRREMYHAATGHSMARYRRTMAGLHSALANDELEVWYQPVFDVDTATVVAFEALLRWRHPQRGVLGPEAFIGAAEKSGLITEVGDHALHKALSGLAAQGYGPHGPGVSVNVSAGQITDPAFVRSVERSIERTGVDPDRVWLELTESALLSDVRAARRSCAALRAIGVHLAIDDFGTGYGALTYLMEFPVESIKIDRTFVSGIVASSSNGAPPDDSPSREPATTINLSDGAAGDPTTAAPRLVGLGRERAIVGALVGLSDQLGLRCVAEGVETEEQLQVLRDLGIVLVQGHLLGRPKPVPSLSDAPIAGLERSSADPLHTGSEGVS